MGKRGQVFPLVAIAALVLVGVVGFAVDAGYHQYRQRVQQTATDSAAIAGAAEYAVGDWSAAAKQDAKTNGFQDTTSGTCPANPSVGTVCVYVATPPDAPDAYSGTTGAVEVQITSYNPTFFESVFQIYNVPITTKAVAVQKTETSDNCVLVLNGNANFNQQTNGTPAPGASPGVDAPNCGLAFNQAVNFHQAVVDAASISCANVSICGNAYSYVQATPAPSAPVTDPCAWISYCAVLAGSTPPCIQPAAPSTDPTTGITTVYAGCYPSGLKLTGYTNVQFQCGFYNIQGNLNASATGTNAIPINITQSCPLDGSQGGVTFYLTGNGQINFRNDVINLASPTTGDYSANSAGEQNVLIYQSPSDTNTVNMQSASYNCGLSSCDSYFNGMIYAPDATLNYNQFNSTSGNGTGTGNVLLIAGTLNANGGLSGFLSAPGDNGTYTITVPVLGE